MGFDNLLMTKSRKLKYPPLALWCVQNTHPGRWPGSLLTIFPCLIGWFLMTPQGSSSTLDSFKWLSSSTCLSGRFPLKIRHDLTWATIPFPAMDHSIRLGNKAIVRKGQEQTRPTTMTLFVAPYHKKHNWSLQCKHSEEKFCSGKKPWADIQVVNHLTLTYGHELWVMTKIIRLRLKGAKISFVCGVVGLSLRHSDQRFGHSRGPLSREAAPEVA